MGTLGRVLALGLVGLMAAPGFGSQIVRIPLGELAVRAEVIVLAGVLKVAAEGDQDRVTLRVAAWLKGTGTSDEITVTFFTRGGLKDFDPPLREGDMGVFFLRGDPPEAMQRAYWGSVALFPYAHFDPAPAPGAAPVGPGAENLLPGACLAAALSAWRGFRLASGQIAGVAAYESGFRRGFCEPPGLVDGSADFNLGHSDGMRARCGDLPGAWSVEPVRR